MAFFRRRGNSITLIHGIRTSSGVRQKVLHTFSSVTELRRLLDIGGWPKFCMEMEQKFPEVAPDWEDVRRQALALEPTTTEADPDSAESLDKLRRALAYAGRELGFLNPDLEGHRQKLLALGPELKNCLYHAQIAMERVRGKDSEMAQELARLLAPDAELTANLIEQAGRCLAQRNWKRAAKFFADARAYDPFDPDVDNSEGIGWMNRGRLAEARNYFERARGLAFQQLPRGDRVYSWSNLRARPYLRATYNLALLLEIEGDYRGSLELFQECLQRCPDDGLAAGSHIGTLHHRLGQFEAALRYYKRAIAENGAELPDPYFDGACALIQEGREGEALEWILKGLSINDWFSRVLVCPTKPTRGEDFGIVDSQEWACDYCAHKGDLWRGKPLAFLQRVLKDKSVQSTLQKIRAADEALADVRPSAERSRRVRRLFSLREELAQPTFSQQVAARLGLS